MTLHNNVNIYTVFLFTLFTTLTIPSLYFPRDRVLGISVWGFKDLFNPEKCPSDTTLTLYIPFLNLILRSLSILAICGTEKLHNVWKTVSVPMTGMYITDNSLNKPATVYQLTEFYPRAF